MYIINEIWINIKSYIFHNIKLQGKHLKIQNSYIKNYNSVVKSMPTIVKPSNGPYVIYTSPPLYNKSIQIAKLMYYNVQLRLSRNRPLFNTIIEYVLLDQFLPKRFSLSPLYEGKSNIIKYYYENIQNVKSKLT